MAYKVLGAILFLMGIVTLLGAVGSSDLYVEQVKAGLVVPSGQDLTFWDEVAMMTLGATVAGAGALIWMLAGTAESGRGH